MIQQHLDYLHENSLLNCRRHLTERIISVCTLPECTFNRLNCTKCLLTNHKDHIGSMVQIQEIMEGQNCLNIANWPPDPMVKNLASHLAEQLIKLQHDQRDILRDDNMQHKGKISDYSSHQFEKPVMIINQMLDEFITNVTNRVNELRYQAILRINSIINPAKFDVQKVAQMYDRCFTLQPVKNCLEAFQDSMIDYPTLEKQIDQFFIQGKHQQSMEYMRAYIKNAYQNINMKEFLRFQDNILNQLNQNNFAKFFIGLDQNSNNTNFIDKYFNHDIHKDIQTQTNTQIGNLLFNDQNKAQNKIRQRQFYSPSIQAYNDNNTTQNVTSKSLVLPNLKNTVQFTDPINQNNYSLQFQMPSKRQLTTPNTSSNQKYNRIRQQQQQQQQQFQQQLQHNQQQDYRYNSLLQNSTPQYYFTSPGSPHNNIDVNNTSQQQINGKQLQPDVNRQIAKYQTLKKDLTHLSDFHAAFLNLSSVRDLKKAISIHSQFDGVRTLQFNQHSDWVTCLSYQEMHGHLASGSSDLSMKLYDLQNPSLLFSFDNAHNDQISAVEYLPYKLNILASGSYDKTIKLWNPLSFCHVKTIQNMSGVNCLMFVDFYDYANFLASANDDNTIKLYDLQKGDECRQVLKGHTNSVQCMTKLEDMRLLASAGWDRVIRLWDIRGSQSDSTVLLNRGHQDWINTIDYFEEQKLLFSGDRDGVLNVWDLRVMKLMKSISGFRPITSLKYMKSIQSLIISQGAKAIVWKINSDNKYLDLLGHKLDVLQILALNKTRKIVTSGKDGLIQVWR